MRIIYFGTSEFAVPSLKALAEGRHGIACVVTQPGRNKGRHLRPAQSPVKECARALSLETMEFDDVNSGTAIKALRGLDADIFVVSAFGQIFGQRLLALPKLYPVNIHASILPCYRGASPLQRAIINGDEKSGITIIVMNEFLDQGDIIAVEETVITDADDAVVLSRRLAGLSAQLIVKTVDRIESGMVKLIPQDSARATYAPKLTKADGLICWDQCADDILNKIRGCMPWPGAYTFMNKKLLKIIKARKYFLEDGRGPLMHGRVMVVSDTELVVSCKGSAIILDELQLEGRRCLKAAEFLRGYNIKQDIILG
ncbi:MAG: methionyl-tRNA formyltransferase [Candidatus Omnitrophica bacterium]|nr:methionyl-tRNA formyltransferase [Candidatus Omnitrophota bacterium]